MMSVSALMALTISMSLSTLEVNNTENAGMEPSRTETAVATNAEGQWLQSFADAKLASIENGLPIVLHFEAEWCGACRQMDSSVLNQGMVLEHLGRSVIGVRVDADRDPGLISQFGISSLPTEVVLDDGGKELARYVGGTSLKDYTIRLENVRAKSAAESIVKHDTTSSDEENLRSCLLVKREGHVVGLGGYSPVAMLRDKQWLKGGEEFVGSYRGVEYFFQSAEEREMFFAGPEQYIPRLHGCDPVELQRQKRAEAGAIELGAFYKGRLFFFMSEANRQRFQNNPAWYADGFRSDDIQNMDEFPFLKTMTLN